MRNVVLICGIAISLLMGGISVDAKTTKKSSKAKKTKTTSTQTSSITASDFLQPFSLSGLNPDEWGVSRRLASKIMVPKKDFEIDDALIRKGFYKVYRSITTEWSEAAGEMVDCNNAYFTKDVADGRISIKEYCGFWEIKFPSAAEKNKFLKTAENIGYKFSRYWDSYLVPGTEEDYWIAHYIFVDGNTVNIRTGGE